MPADLCYCNVLLLPLLRSPTEQDDESLSIPPEVNPVTRPEIDPPLENPCANSFDIRKGTLLDAEQGCGNLGRRLGIEAIEPFTERASTALVEVLADLNH